MRHLLRILEVTHLDRNGEVLWYRENIPNLLHDQGELYCLSALFNTSVVSIPEHYYAGLDNRTSPAGSDRLTNLSQEPTQFGYARQAVSSSTGFVIALNSDHIYQATSNVLTFVASGGVWGPVSNIFLTTSLDNTGFLISSASLGGSHSLNAGEQLTIRLALTLSNVS